MKRPEIDKILRTHHALIPQDSPYQQRVRLLQSVWRHEQGLEPGEHRGAILGSRLPLEHAEDRLSNFLSDRIRDVVRREVIDAERSRDKLFGRPRLFVDLTATQAMCFNLFGELASDLDLATRVLQPRKPESIAEVAAIDFEHNPGRGDEERFTGDKEGFDVFVEYGTWNQERGFLGIVATYFEDLRTGVGADEDRYEEIADDMGIFDQKRYDALLAPPLVNLFRKHLLVGCMLEADLGYSEGTLVFLHPNGNRPCALAVHEYEKSLLDRRNFTSWTLESLVEDIEQSGAGAWIGQFKDRYLAFDKLFALGLEPLDE